MAIILGLMIFCLGLYFLSLFFQVARLEKSMNENVTRLEKYMVVKYSMGDGNKKKNEDDTPEEAAGTAPGTPSGIAPGAAKIP